MKNKKPPSCSRGQTSCCNGAPCKPEHSCGGPSLRWDQGVSAGRAPPPDTHTETHAHMHGRQEPCSSCPLPGQRSYNPTAVQAPLHRGERLALSRLWAGAADRPWERRGGLQDH